MVDFILGRGIISGNGPGCCGGGLVSGVIFAFSNAMQIRTAQAFGTKDPMFQKSVLAAGLLIGVTFGLLGLFVILNFGKSIVDLMAPKPDVAVKAWAYLSVFSAVIMAESVGQNLGSHFNGCGRTRIPLYGYCFSVPFY